jgi:pimeloyl-ACP methyl ester carboxylesterase
VLLNPLAGTARFWQPVLPAFEGVARTVRVEYPGFGGSPYAAVSGCAQLAEWVLDSAQLANESKIHIVGHSFGGWVGQFLASSLGPRVQSLALIGSSLRVYELGVTLMEEWVKVFDSLGVESLLTQVACWSFGVSTFEAMPRLKSQYARTTIEGCTDTRAIRDQLLIAGGMRQPTGLAELKCPILALRGSEDIMAPAICQQELARSNERVKLVEVPGAGHAAVWEQPQFVARELVEFLKAAT